MRVNTDRVFAALGDPARRQVVELLTDGPRRAGELAEAAGVSPPVMSKHLRVLLEAGIVDDERSPADARVRLFFLQRDSLAAVQAWLDQAQAHWAETLGVFKQHVDGGGAAGPAAPPEEPEEETQ